MVIKHLWCKWCDDSFRFSKFLRVFQLMHQSFSHDMTYFNIYTNRILNVQPPCINNIKTATRATSMNISAYHPVSYTPNDICMPQILWHRNCHHFPIAQLNERSLKWQRKFKWHTQSSEESNSFSFPIENYKDLPSNNFRHHGENQYASPRPQHQHLSIGIVFGCRKMVHCLN